MSVEYDLYLHEHKTNVKKAFHWMRDNLLAVADSILTEGYDLEWQIGLAHDESKNDPDEYKAYDAYFYGGNKSYKVTQEFNLAFLRHMHKNPHHWQHWILLADGNKHEELIMDIPYNYIIEMICDWWSFSWKSGNLYEIFAWYEERKDNIKLSPDTRKKLEYILESIKNELTAQAILNKPKGEKV